MNIKSVQNRIDQVDHRIVGWMAHYSLTFLRLGMGIVFLWFGALKFFPGFSPASDLAVRTIDLLSFGLIPENISLLMLAILETAIGLGFLTGKYLRLTLGLLIFQMAGTLTPLLLFPGEAFTVVPFAPTMEGQYIIKNLVLIAAGLVIGSTVRGGRIVAEPQELYEQRTQSARQPVRVEQR